jgi:glucose/arabinose dehydrogenase
MKSFLTPISRPSVKFGLIALFILIVNFSQEIDRSPALATGGIEATIIRFELFSSGFGLITSIEFTADGRLYVSDTIGRIRTVETDGTINPTLFLDLQGQVGSSGEQALTGFVLDPDFENNGVFYVNYTSPQGITNLSRFHTMPGDPNQADPNSEEVLLAVVQPSVIHNGAGMVFGPDGYLYYGLGDGGYFGDPDNNGQNGNTYLGAILRLDVNGAFPYEIPPDNPFVGDPNVLDEIWAMGLRNPWRFQFDSMTDDLYITDVGSGSWEEVDFEAAGSGGGFNYGWRCYEAFLPHNLTGCEPPETYTFPVHAHSHSQSSICAIIGGYVYRGDLFPMIEGHFLFADLCSGRIWGLLRQPDSSFAVAATGKLSDSKFTAFGQDPDGELMIAAFTKIYRISAETVKLDFQMYLPIFVRN